MPWTPKASRESSYPNAALSFVQARKQTTPTATPIAIAGIGWTYPEAGVMQTRPATAPDAAPSTLGLPRVIHSMPAHESVPAAAAKWVTQNALAAKPSDANSLPALNPNQPTHSMAAPRTV